MHFQFYCVISSITRNFTDKDYQAFLHFRNRIGYDTYVTVS